MKWAEDLVREYHKVKDKQKKESSINFCEACIYAADNPLHRNVHSYCKGKAFCFCQHTVIINDKRYTYKVKADHA